MFKHFLIPTDGSPTSNKAAKAGIAVARKLNAKVTVFYAIEELQQIYAEGYAMDQHTRDTIEQYGRKLGQKHGRTVSKMAEAAGVPFTQVIAKALTPHEGIIAAAKKYKCDLIAMASHGRSGITKLLLGSETQKVLSNTNVAVLVLR